MTEETTSLTVGDIHFPKVKIVPASSVHFISEYKWPEPTPEDKELNWDINWDFLVKLQELSKQYGEIPLEQIEAVLKALNKV